MMHPRLKAPWLWLGLGLLTGIPAGWWWRGSSVMPESRVRTERASGSPPSLPAYHSSMSASEAGRSLHDTREAAAEIDRVRAVAVPGRLNDVLIAALHDILGDSFGSRRARRFAEMLEAMRPEDAAAVRNVFREQDKLGRHFPTEFVAFWDRWGEVDGAGALAYIQTEDQWNGRNHAVDVFKSWTARDPRQAAEVALALDPGPLRDNALKGVVHGWTETDLLAATEFVLRHMPVEERPQLGGDMVWSIAYSASAAHAREWFAELENVPAGFRQHATEALMELSSRDSPAAALEAAKITIDDASAASGAWATTVLGNLAQRRSHEEFLQCVEMLAERNVSVAPSGYFHHDPGLITATSEWLRAHPSSPAFDSLALELVRAGAEDDPQVAAQWAAVIKDPARRTEAEALLLSSPLR